MATKCLRKIRTCHRWETSPRSLTPHEGGLAPSHQGGLSSPKRSQHLNNQTNSKVGEVDRPAPQITYLVLARAWELINDVEAFRAAETLLQKADKLAAAIFSYQQANRTSAELASLPESQGDRKARTGIDFALSQHGPFLASPSLEDWLSRTPLLSSTVLLPVVAMAAMSLLHRASVSAVAALSGRCLGTRLGLGGFLTRDLPKTVGGY